MNLQHEDLIVSLYENIHWDGVEEVETCEVNKRAINKALEVHVRSKGYEEKFQKAVGKDETLYKNVSRFTPMHLLYYVNGVVSLDDLLSLAAKGETELGWYPLPLTPQEGSSTGDLCFDALLFEKVAKSFVDVRNQAQQILKGKDMELTIDQLDEADRAALDSVLSNLNQPNSYSINSRFKTLESEKESAENRLKQAIKDYNSVLKDNKNLKDEVSRLTLSSLVNVGELEVKEYSGERPEGRMVLKPVKEVFPSVDLSVNFDVPTFEWDHDHPDVPAIDEHYIFRPDLLERVLYSIITNKRLYLSGDTGTGKTTLIEQTCAHLNYPRIRVNFDSEVTRMDFIGRDTITVDPEGNTVSKFIDGTLPTAMQMPCVFIADEIDFVRPDVAYAMQPALEGNGLRITEDGDRYVAPHKMFRFFATGNTVGQGDENNRYAGARPQSLAFLDRFTVWGHVDYLPNVQLKSLVSRHYPSLSEELLNTIAQYAKEHITAFKQEKVTQPLSPRGVLAIAEACLVFDDFKKSLEFTVIDKANQDDRVTLLGIVNRVAA